MSVFEETRVLVWNLEKKLKLVSHLEKQTSVVAFSVMCLTNIRVSVLLVLKFFRSLDSCDMWIILYTTYINFLGCSEWLSDIYYMHCSCQGKSSEILFKFVIHTHTWNNGQDTCLRLGVKDQGSNLQCELRVKGEFWNYYHLGDIGRFSSSTERD